MISVECQKRLMRIVSYEKIVLVDLFDLVPPQIMTFVRYTAIAGFIAIVPLVINLDYKAFSLVFKEKTITYWWFFVVLTIVPLMVLLYAFSKIFGRLF